ncbi:MAG: hypothetical protein HOP24_08100 [Sideroxydans sp.]|nr:hypothetical protein [Sideroxydans sp.]
MTEKPKPFTMKPEGNMTMKIGPDGAISTSTDKPLEINLQNIKSVGVENLVDIETHEISRLFNSVSHFIKFFGGGEVKFAYNLEGKLLEFSTHHVTLSIQNGERVILKKLEEN